MSKQLYHTVYVVMIDGCKFTMYSGWHYGKFSDIKHDIILFESFDELMDWLSANSWFSGGLCRWDYKLFGKVQRKIVSGDYVFTAKDFKSASYECYDEIIQDARIPQIVEKLSADDFWDYCRDMISRGKAGPYSYAFNGYIPWSR